MPKREHDAEETASRRARRVADDLVRALREQFPSAHVRFSQLDTGGADGLLIIRAPTEEQDAIEAAAGQLVAAAQAEANVWIEPRIERPRGERRDRSAGEGFWSDSGPSFRQQGQMGGKGRRLPRKTAP